MGTLINPSVGYQYADILNKTSFNTGAANFDTITVGVSETFTNLTPLRLISTDASDNLISQNLVGTANQVILTGGLGSGSTTLSLPQNIDTGATPTFVAETLSGLTASKIVGLDLNKKTVSKVVSGTTNQINIVETDTSLTLSTPQNIDTGSSPTFVDINLSSLTASRLLLSDISKNLISSSYGQSDLVLTSTNQIIYGIKSFLNAVNVLSLAITGAQVIELTPTYLATYSSGNIYTTLVSRSATVNSVAMRDSAGLLNMISANISGLTISTPVKTDASNNLISGAISLTSDISGILPIANGGTNSSTALTNGALMISNAGAIVEGTSSTNPTFTSLNLLSATNQIVLHPNSGFTTTLTNAVPSANRIYTIPDAGVDCSYVMTNSSTTQTISGNITINTSNFMFNALTANLPLLLTAGKLVTSGPISLSSTSVTGILPIANGGTNSSTALTNGNIMVSSGGAIVEGTSSTSPSFTGVTVSSLTASKIMLTDASKNLISSSYGESDIVLTSTNQNIAGVKTFTTNPIISNTGTAILKLIGSNPPNSNFGYEFQTTDNNYSAGGGLIIYDDRNAVNVLKLGPQVITASKFVETNANGYLISSTYYNTDFVQMTGNQTVAGVKTFSSQPIVSTLTASKIMLSDASKGLVSSSYAESDICLTSTNQTIAGTKTFSSQIVSTAGGISSGSYFNATNSVDQAINNTNRIIDFDTTSSSSGITIATSNTFTLDKIGFYSVAATLYNNSVGPSAACQLYFACSESGRPYGFSHWQVGDTAYTISTLIQTTVANRTLYLQTAYAGVSFNTLSGVNTSIIIKYIGN